ncbi:E3 ubiquitin-protein ligase COP1-like [Chrysoperla carnea]|uniref:E3 ubiquitin-protein ligase COP1-like n=1 Tax=Chrysoperla carnea TaxID=189513 RepID=UPI001D08DCF7|nr:E3 ubiquitin-protein ligase COP1-like [Chrysoperla carnea]
MATGRDIRSTPSPSNTTTTNVIGSGALRQTRTPKRQRSPNFNNQISTALQTDDKNNEFLCPICFNIIEEAHITRCGHTFCYQCIKRSLETLGRCPKCNFALSGLDQLFPNFLLNELIIKYKQKLTGINALRDSPEGLRDYIANESENFTLNDVNIMLEVLTQRKHLLEAESCVAQNRLVYEFLKYLLQQKEEQRDQLTREVALIKSDIIEVENILKEVQSKCPTLEDVEKAVGDRNDAAVVAMKKEVIELIDTIGSSVAQPTKRERPSSTKLENEKEASANNVPDMMKTILSSRRRRMYAHFDDFVQCYFSSRAKDLHFSSNTDTKLNETVKPIKASSTSDGIDDTYMNSSSGLHMNSGLDLFRENLVKFARYDSLRQLATLAYSSDLFNNSTIVSSIEFDKDNEFFAIAGVTKRIKVFDYGAVIHDAVDIHYPIVEMVSSSKISCVSWNSYHKGTLASSDYEGTVTVWDATTGQRTKTFQEHEKRCWSVDFNNVDTRLIASGSDDARVKLWSINVDHSIATLEVKANVCCVKFNPRSSCHLAFGSADHCVHYYDLRNMKEPMSIFKGHKKAVSYVKFINTEEIVSASTDSQLKMWNINSPHCLRSFVGHINEKNFVGLATDGDYVACGSENNSLYVYYKGLTKQLFSFKFDTVRSVLEQDKKDDEPNEFVSAVCWRQHSNILVAANSQGIIKLLELY